MKAAEFNKKYKLSNELNEKIHFVDPNKRKIISNIAGKPKKIVIEIFKRFFKNPYVAFSFFIFVALLLCAFIIPATSQYQANKPVTGDNLEFIKFLPPNNSPITTRNVTLTPGSGAEAVSDQVFATYLRIKDLVSKDDTPEYVKDYFQILLNSSSFSQIGESVQVAFTYNSYQMYQSYVVYAKLFAYLSENNSNFPAQDVFASWINSAPKVNSILGTDVYGRDVWTASWYATAESIKIAILTAIVQTIIGVSIGAYLGFKAGTRIDTITMRVIEIILSPPSLIWMLLFVSILGVNNWALILSLIITGWAWPVSSTRMFIITVKDEEYITAAKSIGASTTRQVFIHALPAILGKIANSFVKRIPSIILSLASLAFLGFYKDNNNVNLGQLLIDATPQISNNFWILLLPSLILLTLSLSLHFIAIGVHDSLDPRIISANKK
ncbi:ABC transporter permease [Mycoplasma sp. 1573]